jgi:AGZA family xanthine/uracil permease-like MFS transporter
MLKSIKNIDFGDYTIAIPAFLTITVMPIASSIADGMMFGFISYVILQLINKKGKDIHPMLYVIVLLFLLKLIIPLL